MPSIFSKNAILSGRIDHYCLICAEHFTSEEDTLEHIVDTQHKEKLKLCGYFEKYKDDFIRKTKDIYFCELCSLTFSINKMVELHVGEPTHIEEKNKNMPCLKRVKDIIAFNKFFITDDAWNGCAEDKLHRTLSCVLCSAEFDDTEEFVSHKASRSHILKLIKSEVMFDEVESAVYRTIGSSKQCLTCNKLISSDSSHFKTAEHKEALIINDQHHISQTKQTSQSDKIENTTKNLKNTKNEAHVKVNNKKADEKDANKGVNGDVIGVGKNNNKEVEKDANKDVKKDANKGVDREKLKKELKKPADSSKEDSAAELDKIYCNNLKAKNYITGGFSEKWCLVCEWLLDESPEQHIRSKHHQNLLKLHKERLAKKDSNNKNNVDEKSNLYECVDKYQKSNVNIDLINETAVCKKCSKNIDFNTNAIEKHIEEHKNTLNKKSQEKTVPILSGIKSNGTDKTTLFTKPVLLSADKNKRRSPSTVSSVVKVEDYAKQHGLSHNRADNSFYCKLCCRRLPTTLNDLKNHVASKIHTENMTKQSQTDSPKARVKVPLFDVIKTFEIFETDNEGWIIILNDKYWLNAFGFFLTAKNNEILMCHGCHIDLTPENIMEHIMASDNHREILEKCLLVTSLENEFIREIKLEVYHCGYCNIVEHDWDDILEHLSMAEHKKEKSKAEESLKNHSFNPYQRITLREANDVFLKFMCRNRLF